jgi:pilus assembly protein Flp/PilA
MIIFYGKEVSGMLAARRQKGQGLVEYGLLIVLIAIAVIAVLTLMGPIIGNIFSKINNSFPK